MKFPVTMYQDEEGWYVVECPLIPGCMSQGKTKGEALQNIQEAIQLCLEVRQEKGLPLTIHSLEVEVPVYVQASTHFWSESCTRFPAGRMGNSSSARKPRCLDQI